MKRTRLTAAFAFVVGLAGVQTAHAELYRDVARGLALFDFRFAGERNILGDGFTVFADAFYNNRRFNFGLADLTLTGQLRSSFSYTECILPAVEFGLSTGGSPLTYIFNINTGAQDLTATGRVLINMSVDVNALGFYDQTIQISNRGQFATDGLGFADDGTLDFDIGPINVSGNIFADLIAALTEPIFAAQGVENPFAKFSSRATKAAELEKSTDELRARIAAGEILSDQEIATLVNNTILAAVLTGQSTDHLFDGLNLPASFMQDVLGENGHTAVAASIVPEPTSALLLAPALLLLRRRRTC